MAIVARCPSCGTKLAIKDSSSLGKKARCGKCQNVFVLKASPGSTAGAAAKKKSPPRDELDDFGLDDDAAFGDDFGDDLDDDDDFGSAGLGRPAGKRAAGQGRKPVKRKKSRAAWVKPALIGLGSVLGLGIVIGGVMLVAGVGSNATQQVASGPAETANAEENSDSGAGDANGSPAANAAAGNPTPTEVAANTPPVETPLEAEQGDAPSRFDQPMVAANSRKADLAIRRTFGLTGLIVKNIVASRAKPADDFGDPSAHSSPLLNPGALIGAMSMLGGPPGGGRAFGGPGAFEQGIEGEWVITQYEQQGQQFANMTGARVTIGAGKLTIELADQSEPVAQPPIPGQPAIPGQSPIPGQPPVSGQAARPKQTRQTFDVTHDPEKKHLDLRYKDSRQRPWVDACIYELSGDTMQISLGKGGRRPAGFQPTNRNDNPPRVLITLQRAGAVPGVGVAGFPGPGGFPGAEFQFDPGAGGPAPITGAPGIPAALPVAQPGGGAPVTQPGGAPAASGGPAGVVTADELGRLYAQEQAELGKRYGEKRIRFSGTVQEIDGAINLWLSTSAEYNGLQVIVIATLTSDATVKPGDRVIVEGEYEDAGISGPIFRNCQVVGTLAPPAPRVRPANAGPPVTTGDWGDEYAADVAAFKAKYEGKTIRVTGMPDAFEGDMMRMRSPRTAQGVIEFHFHCVPGTTSQLNIGDSVTMEGTLESVGKSVLTITSARRVGN